MNQPAQYWSTGVSAVAVSQPSPATMTHDILYPASDLIPDRENLHYINQLKQCLIKDQPPDATLDSSKATFTPVQQRSRIMIRYAYECLNSKIERVLKIVLTDPRVRTFLTDLVSTLTGLGDLDEVLEHLPEITRLYYGNQMNFGSVYGLYCSYIQSMISPAGSEVMMEIGRTVLAMLVGPLSKKIIKGLHGNNKKRKTEVISRSDVDMLKSFDMAFGKKDEPPKETGKPTSTMGSMFQKALELGPSYFGGASSAPKETYHLPGSSGFQAQVPSTSGFQRLPSTSGFQQQAAPTGFQLPGTSGFQQPKQAFTGGGVEQAKTSIYDPSKEIIVRGGSLAVPIAKAEVAISSMAEGLSKMGASPVPVDHETIPVAGSLRTVRQKVALVDSSSPRTTSYIEVKPFDLQSSLVDRSGLSVRSTRMTSAGTGSIAPISLSARSQDLSVIRSQTRSVNPSRAPSMA